MSILFQKPASQPGLQPRAGQGYRIAADHRMMTRSSIYSEEISLNSLILHADDSKFASI